MLHKVGRSVPVPSPEVPPFILTLQVSRLESLPVHQIGHDHFVPNSCHPNIETIHSLDNVSIVIQPTINILLGEIFSLSEQYICLRVQEYLHFQTKLGQF
jgi:hypothetical protein